MLATDLSIRRFFQTDAAAEGLPRMNPGTTSQRTRKDRQLVLEETLKLRFKTERPKYLLILPPDFCSFL